MKMLTLSFLLAVASFARAADDKIAYPSFTKDGAKFVFVDFQTANYSIKYDVATKQTSYEATVVFKVLEAGRAIFDVVENPTSFSVDGVPMDAPVVKAPNDAATFRATAASLHPGLHEMKVTGEIKKLVTYSASGVRSAYWLNDLYDRSYLEQFLPSSFEYDRVAMTFNIDIVGSTVEHTILTNGPVESDRMNHFRINFPANYNTAAIFLHLLPTDRIHKISYSLKSVDGRDVPVTIYYSLNDGAAPDNAGTQMLERHRSYLAPTFNQLEKDYGAFPHSKILVYAADGGGFPGIAGMEYCGATMTDAGSLPHELTHSYFGRGLMPANGDAGWLDEAITTWSTRNYAEGNSTVVDPSRMYSQGVHVRYTHRSAYSLGVQFFSQIAYQTRSRGQDPMKAFFADLIENHLFEPYSNDDFWAWSKEHYGFNLLDLIGTVGVSDPEKSSFPKHNAPEHKRFTDAQLLDLL